MLSQVTRSIGRKLMLAVGVPSLVFAMAGVFWLRHQTWLAAPGLEGVYRTALAALLDAADAALPESGSRRGLEPLCAAYGGACGRAIRAALARGDSRAVGFHGDVRVARLPREDVLQYGDPDVLFFNVNTADDLARAESLCRSLDSSR